MYDRYWRTTAQLSRTRQCRSKADLRLDQREAAIEMGALAPGAPDDSELLRRVIVRRSGRADAATGAEEVPLAAAEADPATLDRRRGGVSTPLVLDRPRTPRFAGVRSPPGCANPIDMFVLARLESIGLEPAAEADRRTLARRVCLDLTGLPPQPTLVEAFVVTRAPKAYERLVDQLLQSARWGEHRGRYWLDVARYADTHGIHFDNYREIWTYRDWVIDAFNRNMPFDRFTIEQLAGDLLPEPTLRADGLHQVSIAATSRPTKAA